jgi:hypothetical protein
MTTDRKGAGLLPGASDPTPGRLAQPSSTCLRDSPGSKHLRWRLAPGLRHLVAAIGYGEKSSKATVSTHPKYSQDLHQIYSTYASVSKEGAESVD